MTLTVLAQIKNGERIFFRVRYGSPDKGADPNLDGPVWIEGRELVEVGKRIASFQF